MASLPKPRAKLLDLPLEVTTELVRQLYRNEVIELVDIGSLARLGDVAATQSSKSLAIFKIELLCKDLAGRLIMQEAILKFACQASIHHIDLIRFPLLHHLRRLRIDVEYLNFKYPLGVLSNLPAIEEVTVIVKCANWRGRIEVEIWVYAIDDVIFNLCAPYVTVEQLTHSEWRYDLVLQATFWEGFGSKDVHVSHATHKQFGFACKVCISKGKITELDTAEGARLEWKEALMFELDVTSDETEEEGKQVEFATRDEDGNQEGNEAQENQQGRENQETWGAPEIKTRAGFKKRMTLGKEKLEAYEEEDKSHDKTDSLTSLPTVQCKMEICRHHAWSWLKRMEWPGGYLA